jgi:glutathione S-transferase
LDQQPEAGSAVRGLTSCGWPGEERLTFQGGIHAYFARLNPFRLTPILQLEDGRTICESTAINEYLEETHPNPPMLPKDPYERARIRMLEDSTDLYLYRALYVRCGFGFNRRRVPERLRMGRRLSEPFQKDFHWSVPRDTGRRAGQKPANILRFGMLELLGCSRGEP